MARKINFDPPATEPAETREVAPQRARPLLGLERTIKQSSALGAISQSLGGISEKVKRAEEIEQKLIEGQVIVDLDPALIDNSFVPDRMEATEEQNAAFRELIRQHGQNVPILVRPKPLVIAQGQENSGRTDLTFIERARFAARLEDRKFSREIIMASLNVDKAALSRLIAIATRVPAAVIDAIGPAPAFGRVRWQELTDLLEQEGNRARAIEMVKAPTFNALDTDKRFEALAACLREKTSRARAENWAAKDGTHAAKVSRVGKRLTLTFDDRVAPRFGDFVRERLQTLYDEFKAGDPSA